MKKLTFTLMLVCLTGLFAQAQLKYLSTGKLTFGNVTPYLSYTIRSEVWGHYYSHGSQFLAIGLATSNPRIAGTGNQVVFYNTETSTFNTIQVASVVQQSDLSAKKNIEAVSNGLKTVMKLNPVSYEWKNPEQGYKDPRTGKVARSIGFIAQEVEKVLPDLVMTDSVDHKMMDYTGIIPVLTKAVQELSEEVRVLKSELAGLKEGKGSDQALNREN